MTRDIWIAPDRLFDGRDLHDGAALRLRNGTATEIAAKAPAQARRVAGLLVPGFLDLQVNGGGGVMLNSQPDADGMRTIAAAHRRFGTVALLPTLISDTADQMDRAVDAAIATRGEPGIAGLHLEGPHIAPDRRGTHARTVLRRLDEHTLDAVARLRRHGIAVLITVAPEAATPEQIAALTNLGAVVSLGHSDCDAAAAQAALAAGATAFTHLFNAMSQMTHRAPGMVGTAINSDAYCGIICDGHHVAYEMVGLALRARPRRDRMLLVSDAMATVGGPDSFDLYGQTITLRDGQLVNAEGSLAGAHTTMLDGVAGLVSHVGVPLDEALRMATAIPAEAIGLPALGRITDRRTEDLLLLSPDLDLVGTLADALAATPLAHAGE